MDRVNFKLVNTLLVVGIIYLLYAISDLWLGVVIKLFEVLSPFILAFAIAYVVYPLVKKLEDAGSPKWLAILSVCVLGMGSLFLIILLTVPLIYDQMLLFISNLSVFLADLSSKYEISFGGLELALKNFSTDVITNLGSSISDGAISVVNTSVGVLSKGVVVICAAIYFLIDMKKIRSGIRNYFTIKNKKTYNYLFKLDKELTKYIGGMGLNILIQMMEYTLAFFLIGHPNYLILGILSGLSAIIPWFGGFIVAVLSLLVSSVISTRLFILTALICLVCPVLDGNVIGPKVYGKTNKIPPLLVIFAVSAGGVLAGFWGIVISLPVAIALRTTIGFYYKDISSKIRRMKVKN